MKKHLLALTISILFAVSANAAVSGCPSGWVKSGDGKECVLTEKVDTPAIGISDTTRPICINGFTYESATNKCSKTVSANTNPVNKINAYQGALVFGVVREIVNGSCGTAKNTYSYTQPSGSALCSSGTNSGVSLSNNTWTWSCAGTYTGSTDYSCLTYKKVDGVCGSANGQTLTDPPASGALCNVGGASGVSTGASGWNWSCSGINTGSSTNCFANKYIPPSSSIPAYTVCVSVTEEAFSFSQQKLNNFLSNGGKVHYLQFATHYVDCVYSNDNSYYQKLPIMNQLIGLDLTIGSIAQGGTDIDYCKTLNNDPHKSYISQHGDYSSHLTALYGENFGVDTSYMICKNH